MLFRANFNPRSRQFLDCFSFGICEVRDAAARKLKRVQMIKRVVPRYSSRTAGSYLIYKQTQKTVCYIGYGNCHFPSSPKYGLPHIYDEYYPF